MRTHALAISYHTWMVYINGRSLGFKFHGVQVRRLTDKSKGLFATQHFILGDVIWQEPPLLAALSFNCPVSCCCHCLRAMQVHAPAARAENCHYTAHRAYAEEESFSRHYLPGGLECPGHCGHRYYSRDPSILYKSPVFLELNSKRDLKICRGYRLLPPHGWGVQELAAR